MPDGCRTCKRPVVTWCRLPECTRDAVNAPEMQCMKMAGQAAAARLTGLHLAAELSSTWTRQYSAACCPATPVTPPCGAHLQGKNKLSHLTRLNAQDTGFQLLAAVDGAHVQTGSLHQHLSNPTCWRLLMTSISCRVTTCTASLRFCSSPSGHATKRVAWPVSHSSGKLTGRLGASV